MTDQTKIPLPGEPDREGKSDRSLLERASGTFGLDPFRPARMPVRLDEPPMKRARAVRRIDDDTHASHGAALATAKPETSLPVTSAPLDVPEPIVVEHPVSFGGPVHQIDRARLASKGMIVPESGSTALLEEFRIVKRQLLAAAQSDREPAARRVLVTSPHSGEGKTFCAVNLSIAMAAERGGEVVLVDADIAQPSIVSLLGLPGGPGLMDALADPHARVEDLVLKTDIGGLFVLSAGNQGRGGSELLASARTAEVLRRLTQGSPNRMIVFDSPPALAASPAADLAKHVGQTLLVCRADRTGRSALEDAVHLLGACPDIKLLLNAAHFSPSGRKFGTYHGFEG